MYLIVFRMNEAKWHKWTLKMLAIYLGTFTMEQHAQLNGLN